jgi:two-component system chemotaxis response regulator CheY
MAKTILVVEDYEDIRSFLKYLLEDRGYEVCEARDGIEAFDKFKQEHPDLILMDISLPQVDGLTATKAIRELEANGENIPIIAVTAFGQLYYKKAIEAGCNELIDKPVDFDSIETAIHHYLEE